MKLTSARVDAIFQTHVDAVVASTQMSSQIVAAASLMIGCLQNGSKIMACGNGGSAADAQHFACELVGRFLTDSKPMAALALSTDPSTMTALGNDYGFDLCFSRQVEAVGREGDVLLGISTSGNSANVLLAAKAARAMGIKVVSLTGKSGGNLQSLSDVCLTVPSHSTPRIQEVHELIIHVLCELIEDEIS